MVSLLALQLSDASVQRYDDATKPDLRAGGYSRDDLVELLAAYGPEGRVAYGVNLVVDTVYPLALAAATVLLAARAFDGRRRWLWAAPLAFAGLDVVENVLLGVATAVHPDVPAALVAVSSPLTQVKLVTFLATMAVLLVSVAVVVVRWWRGRSVRPSA
ncbi:hypothetical protein [Actinotalea sp. Marseille-Q4924]|uniref:hypothetical protein n=1 Tax=Actinotalea sp. Marseille-Q4924 TaxID=2866571 RepID=UPI001CE46338|nr:hypothetical protein [Actinotalea sp. Marseille-Q4924]